MENEREFIEAMSKIDPEIAMDGPNLYRIHLHEFDTLGTLVYAHCAQDALDELVDRVEDSIPGLFMDEAEVQEYQADNDGDLPVCAGNYGRILNSEEYLQIVCVKRGR